MPLELSKQPPSGDVAITDRDGAKRLASVDVCRVIAAFAVVCIHCEPFSPNRIGSNSPALQFIYTAIAETSRFAVSFFFCVSGYFWGKKIRSGTDSWPTTQKMLSRLAILYAFWCAVYLLLFDFATMWRSGLMQALLSSYTRLLALRNPFRLALEGDAVHLWFLPALFYALAIAYFFVSRRRARLLVITAIVLYIVGVFGHAYSATRLGFSLHIGHFLVNTRNGPFCSTLLFTTGYLASARNPKRGWAWLGLAIFACGLALHFSESAWIHSHTSYSGPVEVVFGTFAMGLGSFLVAVASPKWLQNPIAAKLGKSTLGIYCIHYYFVLQLNPVVAALHSTVSEALFPFAVFALSAFAVWGLAKLSFMRRFVQ